MPLSSSDPAEKLVVTAARISAQDKWRALYNPSADTNVTVNITSGSDTYSEDLLPKQLLPVVCIVNTTSGELHGYLEATPNRS